ncbi:HD-GYP domain-containing protein [uncultured Roseibium sp.]|uniref:HD-GYP domain-containing protein n=1 Tax=uncultured Roseibium sp. TaxID=1936171 RepID=UPI003216ACF9
MRILLLVPERKKCPVLFRQLAQFFDTVLIDYAGEAPIMAEPVEFILADVRTSDPVAVANLRAILDKAGDSPRIGLINIEKRQEQVQAKALGFAELWDEALSLQDALEQMRPLIGTYSAPNLPSDTPDATRVSVDRLCATFDKIALSVMTDDQLPVTQMAEAVQLTLSAIKSDGLREWMSAVQGHHSHTFRHSLMVTGYAVAFARQLGASAEEHAVLGIGAIVHDIGKVRIPLSILDKPGKLTPEEFDLVKKHPVYSRMILSGRPEIGPDVLDLALHHHEYLDGSGYPDGLSADQINRHVRMLTICDIYSALTEERAYKKAFGSRQAFAMLLEMGGKIDQDLLQKFRPVAFRADFGEVRRGAAPTAKTG